MGMEAYNHMASSIGKGICLKSWKKSKIQEALENGLEDNLDHLKDFIPSRHLISRYRDS